MDEYSLTRDDLLLNLYEQLYFLDLSLSNFSRHERIKRFDNRVLGSPLTSELQSEVEGKRIATIIRILVHDTQRSISLLKLLELKDQTQYLNTSAPNDGKLHSMTGMHGVRGTLSDQYLGLVAKVNQGNSLIAVPLFNQHLPEWYGGYSKLAFDDWWTSIIIENKGHKLTRSELILKIANKDGGAHVDPYLPANYYVTKKSELQLNIMGIETNFERNIVYASVAQIGWELLNSIEPGNIIMS